jgi:hypothetical protein
MPVSVIRMITTIEDYIPDLDQLLDQQEGVLRTGTALRYMSAEALQWRVRTGRWQQPCKGIVVTHSGALSSRQQLWVASLWAGPGSALGGLTAARLDGFRGFESADEPIFVIRPPGRVPRQTRPPMTIVVHYSRHLGEDAVHPARYLPRTRIARSLVDAAAWRLTDRGAQAILAAGVQQGVVLPQQLADELDRRQQINRRAMMRATVADIAGGAYALSELDLLNYVVRPFGLPVPDRQVYRRDARGRRRWLDAAWEEAKVIVEVDGAGHADVLQYWDDMDRDNGLKLQGYTTLRYAAFMIRYQADYVAGQITQALHDGGMVW